MKKSILFYCLFVLIFALSSCNSAKKADTNEVAAEQVELPVIDDSHNARNSLDYYGIYEGITPCIDCEGLKVTVTLNTDNTYVLHNVYIQGGKESSPTEFKGKYTWDDNGSVITLDGVKDAPSHFFVGEGSLTIVDENGNEVGGELEEHYVLKQIKTF